MPTGVHGEQLQLRVFHGGHQITGLAWNKFRANRFPYWVWYANGQRGASVRLADGRLHALEPGWINLIPPWTTYDCVTTRPVPHLWTSFDVVGLPGSLVRQCFPDVLRVPLAGNLQSCARAMAEAIDRGRIDQTLTIFAIKSALYATMAVVFAGLSDERLKSLFTVASGAMAIAPALELVQAHPLQQLGNRTLADACSLSERQFIRVFRKALGQTPAQHQLERRIAEAARRLAFSDASIATIADECGFPDRYYFSRVFSRRMGSAPAAYRNMRLG
jgi:AraC family transcriptional regulator of arabinose operon